VGEFLVKVHSPSELIAKNLILNGSFEQSEINLLCSLAKPGDFVVDIGANIGLHTLHLSRVVGSAGRVFAFEPDPANLEILKHNIQANSCENVTVFPFALGAETTRNKLYLCRHNKGAQSFAKFDESTQAIDVEVRRIEEFIGDSKLSLMKLDVEGAEPMVWAGTGNNKPDHIVFEFVPWQLKALGNDPLEFLQTLTVDGYHLFLIEGENLLEITPEAMISLAAQDRDENNILAKKMSITNDR
jgi:FkbM family methyltransferase